MKKYFFLLCLVLLSSSAGFAQDQLTLIYGKSETGKLSWSNTKGAVLDSCKKTGSSADILYEITVASKSGSVAQVKFLNIQTRQVTQRPIVEGSFDTSIIPGFRLRFNDTLTVNTAARVQFSTLLPVKADSLGALFESLWTGAKVDSVATISSAPTSIVFTQDYPRGITVIANTNLKFRTTRMTGWIALAASSSIYVPLKLAAGDTFLVKSSTLPGVVLMRGK